MIINHEKILVIGDIHGRNIWKHIVEKEKPDLTIFLGDYFDSYDIPLIDQLYNFNNIIRYKEQFCDDVILLIGNHDFHYFNGINVQYAGYQKGGDLNITSILEEAYKKRYLQVCYLYNNFLFSHAGFSKSWCEAKDIDTSQQNWVDNVNYLFYYRLSTFHKCSTKPYGDSIYECPLWIRPSSLIKDSINVYTQIVGHTSKNTILNEINIWINDSLEYKNYLIIENNEVIVRKLI